ncbi:MAG TPA: FISUMP domain-containing protein, partial [Patescibacteria group bacterium]|nr:FISUMP domain-containing protein [Patescibacteria group bacterium]
GSEVAGAQGICMDGWHIPTDEEINILENYVIDYINSPSPQYPCSINEVGWGRCADNDGTYSGTYGAGKSLKAVGQGNGTDDVGFDGRFGGYRHPVGTYSSFDSGLFLWSSTFSSSISAFRRLLYLSNSTVYRYSNNRDYGFSIRCLKD